MQQIPTHVAIIMDGNGRWAERRGLSRVEGHRAGVDNLHQVVRTFSDHQVKYLTLYAFSTENWSRPEPEVKGLLLLLNKVLMQDVKILHAEEVRILYIGEREHLSSELQNLIQDSIELTKDNKGLILTIALDYGSHGEILQAVRRIIADKVSPRSINETVFNKYLYTSMLPEPDLIIRTGGEMRLSNFLLWQAAYSELYFTSTLWPEFDRTEIEKALTAYSERERRFGGLA